MEHMRQVAFETVLRACGFASLGIFCVMTGMSFERSTVCLRQVNAGLSQTYLVAEKYVPQKDYETGL